MEGRTSAAATGAGRCRRGRACGRRLPPREPRRGAREAPPPREPAAAAAERAEHVRLYQDALVGAGELGGEPGRCWEELCLAVLGAQHLVYVAGWSAFPRVRLLQGAMSPEMAAKAAEVRALGGVAVEDMSLGDLLKYKSQEGVRVLLLLCDDTTSLHNFFLRTVRHRRVHQ